MSYRRLTWVAAVSLFGIAVVLLTRWFVVHWGNPEEQNLVGVLAAFIPAALSFALLWVPDSQLSIAKRWIWRATVICVGVVSTTLILMKDSIDAQVTKNENAKNAAAITSAITKAVDKANQHTDRAMGELRADFRDIASGVNANLEKIKPIPIENAELKFTLYPEGLRISAFPLKEIELPVVNDIVNIPFTFRNVSNTTAREIDIWIFLCKGCAFAEEPDKFRQLPGMASHMRYRKFNNLNSGTNHAAITVAVRVAKGMRRISIAFKNACSSCGPMSNPETFIVRLKPSSVP